MPKNVAAARKTRNHRRQNDFRAEAVRRNAFHRHLRCEVLENRCLLSGTHTVLQLGDGLTEEGDPEYGTLRYAISQASSGDTIRFSAELTGTIVLEQGELTIDKSLTIQGPGASLITIDGDAFAGIFYVDDGTSENINVQISGLTLTNGWAVEGGAIASVENLTATDLVITNNSADNQGGGIWASASNGGTTTIQNTTFSGNSSGGDGGGIWVLGNAASVTIQFSTISGNAAGADGGGIYASAAANGAVTIQNCTLSGSNEAGVDGGGIRVKSNSGATVIVQDTTVSGASAPGGGGGGICVESNGGATTVRNTAISGNTADACGGGIYAFALAGGSTTVQDCTIAGNNAGLDGGGLWAESNGGSFAMRNTTVSGNTAAGSGGGIFSDTETASTSTIQNTTVSGNTSTGFGGGLYVCNYGTAKLQNSTITRNSAGIGGGGVYSGDSSTLTPVVPVIVESTIIAHNTDTTTDDEVRPDIAGSLLSLFHSLVGDNAGSEYAEAPIGSPDANGNLIGDATGSGVIDPKLGQLVNNGGTTDTCALLTGSPAIAMGSNSAQLTTDERGSGYARQRAGGYVDIGAYQVLPAELVVLDGSTEITNGQTSAINVGTAAHGAAGASKTFTIRNDGELAITLTTPFADTSHFILADPGKTVLGAGESTTFVVTLNTGTAWTGSEVVSLVGVDADGVAVTFSFTVSGTVTAIPAEITVLDGSTILTDGQTTPINLGSAAHNGAGVSRTFTIRNDGDQPLTLTVPFADPSHFIVSDPAQTTLAAGQTTTFTVTLVTATVWTGSETISFVSNDADESPFTFVVSGTVTALPAEITVLDGATVLTSGQTTPINLGAAVHNAAGLSKTFTIRNDGDEMLTLTTPFADTTHFTVSDPGASTLAAGASTTFTVTLLTGTVWTGSETISFLSNDANESPFTFVVSGAVTTVPAEITVLDGSTSITCGQTTPIALGSVVRGATGPSLTFTIRNDGEAALSLTAPFADTAHFAVSDPGTTILAAGASTTFTVTLLTGSVWSGSETISFVSNDANESPFTFVVSGTVAAIPAEITVLDGATILTDGQTTPIDLGSAAHNGAGLSKTFTIRNDGEQPLTLTVPFADTTHFTVGDPSLTTLAAGQTATFTVTLTTGSVWTGSETISFVSNDSDESPFTFVVSGAVTAIPAEITVLDGATVLTCGQTTPINLGAAVHNAAGLSKTFTIRNDGDQTLSLTTPFADSAHFTVSDPGVSTLAAGASTTFTVTLLTGTVWTGSETISFLSNDANESPFTFVVSGAVTTVPAEITVLDGSTSITCGQTTPIALGSVVRGATGPSLTFTIRNDGEAALSLTAPFADTTHFAVSDPGTTILAAGASTTFTVTLLTGSVWSGSETISFVSNDANESPFTFVVSAAVTGTLPEITILDGSTEIVSGQTTPIDFGSVVHNAAAASKTFTICNDGEQTLTLTTPFANTSHFIVGQPGKTALAGGESTTFTVTLQTGSVWAGSEQISLVNSDADGGDGVESPFTFVVSGTVTAIPAEITVLQGATVITNGQTVDLGTSVLDTTGRTVTFTIRNDGDEDLTLTMPTGGTTHFGLELPVGGGNTLAAGETTTFRVTLLTDAVWTGSEAISLVSNDTDENPFTITLSGVVSDLRHDMSTIGLYIPGTSTYYLRNSNDSGYADLTFMYGVAGNGWKTIAGDWDGDGVDTVGLYDPSTSTFYLKNGNSSGFANETFVYGVGNAGWTPLAGDWDGDGIDTVGLYDPASAIFYLRNTNTSGYANLTFMYGVANEGWIPLVGDWTLTGKDTIGVYVPSSSFFYLRNTNTRGFADTTFMYGVPDSGWMPMTGDWNGDGQNTVGLYDPVTSIFYLRDSNSRGFADTTFLYGVPNTTWVPVAGDWDGLTSGLKAADGAVVPSSTVSTLTSAELSPVIDEAIARWMAADLDATALARLKQVDFVVDDLSGSSLGKAGKNQIVIDGDAAGHGWFVDSTPASDEEFTASVSGQQFKAIDARAVDRIDLLTVVEHELGHVLGLDDLDALAGSLMSGELGLGVRRDPAA